MVTGEALTIDLVPRCLRRVRLTSHVLYLHGHGLAIPSGVGSAASWQSSSKSLACHALFLDEGVDLVFAFL